MGKGFTISRVGHVGIHVTDMDRSLAWYRDILGLTLTGRWPAGGGEMAFMRFDEYQLAKYDRDKPVKTRANSVISPLL